MRPIPDAARKLVEKWEEFRAEPYIPAPGDVPTIGFGSTRDAEGKPVTMQHPAITRETAVSWLDRDMANAAQAILRLVQCPLDDAQYSALLDFTYNLGSAALQRSALRNRLNGGDRDIGSEFLKWDKCAGRKLAGLAKRRMEEKNLWEGK